MPDAAQREKKLSRLYLAAFNFIIDRSNWNSIMALADYMLAGRKNTLECEEIIAVLDAYFFVAGRRVWRSGPDLWLSAHQTRLCQS
ncbi:MAG: hypothetical protein PHG00_13130 [Methylococcales bacterium]|nr:hypothetical protein [Methylococcales bacterium]